MLDTSHAVEVLVLGLLVVVYKIPHSSCIVNTAVVLEPGTMVCAYNTAVYLVHRGCLCHIYSWFLPMSWMLDLTISLSICRAYICSVGYAELSVVLLHLLQWCITCCPNRELWKFTQSDG